MEGVYREDKWWPNQEDLLKARRASTFEKIPRQKARAPDVISKIKSEPLDPEENVEGSLTANSENCTKSENRQPPSLSRKRNKRTDSTAPVKSELRDEEIVAESSRNLDSSQQHGGGAAIIKIDKNAPRTRILPRCPIFWEDDDHDDDNDKTVISADKDFSNTDSATNIQKDTSHEPSAPPKRKKIRVSANYAFYSEPNNGILCNICGELDNSNDELHTFLLQKRPSTKPYLCLTCNRKFAPAELARHKAECFLMEESWEFYKVKEKKYRMMACSKCNTFFRTL